MSKVITNATIYTGWEKYSPGYLRFGATVQAVGPMRAYEARADEEVIDGTGKILVPGFIDVHSHGGYGIDAMDADPKKLDELAYKLLAEGITSYFPTTMTQSDENIERALTVIGQLADHHPIIHGIHLEGPFVSPEYKGAQPEQFMRAGDANLLRKWHELSGRHIKLVTYAPEIGDVSAFEKYAEEAGIVLSAGHSGAHFDELKRSKATHVTHLFNGQLGLHHREPGVAGFGLLDEATTVELIVDGLHIHPEMVKLAYRAKGAEGIHLITDSMRAKGLPDGESELGGQKVYVKDGEARLESGALAGSILRYIDGFRNMIEFTDCSVSDAVKMSSVNQARAFDLEGKGLLEVGFDADMVLMDASYQLEQTILGGEVYDFRKEHSRSRR